MGAERSPDIARFCARKIELLRRFLPYVNGCERRSKSALFWRHGLGWRSVATMEHPGALMRRTDGGQRRLGGEPQSRPIAAEGGGRRPAFTAAPRPAKILPEDRGAGASSVVADATAVEKRAAAGTLIVPEMSNTEGRNLARRTCAAACVDEVSCRMFLCARCRVQVVVCRRCDRGPDLLHRNLRSGSPPRQAKGSSPTSSGNSPWSRHARRPKSPLPGQTATRDGSWSC